MGDASFPGMTQHITMSWWNYGMETLSALLAIGEGNPPVHYDLFLEWHNTLLCHNGIMAWERFVHYWPFVRGIQQFTVNFFWNDIAHSLIKRFMGPTWGPSGADRTQVGPMLAPWTLLSGLLCHDDIKTWKCISGREGTKGFSLQRTTNAELWFSSCWTNSQSYWCFEVPWLGLQRYIRIFTLFVNMKSWYIFVIHHLYIWMQIDTFFQGNSMGWKTISAL